MISNTYKENGQPNQFVKKVILSEDMVVAALLFSQYFPLSRLQRGFGGRKHVLIAAITLIKFVTVYSQRARQAISIVRSSSPPKIGGHDASKGGRLTSKHPPACCYFTLTKRHNARERHVSSAFRSLPYRIVGLRRVGWVMFDRFEVLISVARCIEIGRRFVWDCR
jgi:hypothetical protein